MPPYRYSFDRIASRYDSSRELPRSLQERVVEILREELRSGTTLEVGVGTGRVARPLQSLGLSVHGVDVSLGMLETGRRGGLAQVVLGDAERLPYRDASFDYVMMNHMLHLIERWTTALHEACRVSRRSFLSVLGRSDQTPNLDAEYDRVVTREGLDTSRPGVHERDLGERTPPDEVRLAGVYVDEVPASTLIDLLEARSYTSQWEVPERLHQEAVARLRASYRGATVRRSLRVEVAKWDVVRLRSASLGPLTHPGRRE